MASCIDITHSHQLEISKVKALIDDMTHSLIDEWGIDSTWDGDTIRFARGNMDGFIAVDDKEIHVYIKLDLLLSAFKSTLEAKIQRKLEEYFS